MADGEQFETVVWAILFDDISDVIYIYLYKYTQVHVYI